MSLTRDECCVVPTRKKKYFFKSKYLPFLLTLLMLFVLKQQHYTLTKVKKVKS